MSDDENVNPIRSKASSALSFADLAGSIPLLPGREDADLETIIAEIREDYANEMARRFIDGERFDPDTDDLPDGER